MRLDKFVCKSTPLSRTEAVQAIHHERVLVNGVAILDEAAQVHENNHIILDGKHLVPRPFRYLLLHKPANCLSANISEPGKSTKYPSVFDVLNIDNSSELHLVGRLDADTTGLLLATDDGRWSFTITSPNSDCSKVYRVGLAKPLGPEVADTFLAGILLQGERELTLPAKLEIIAPTQVLLTLTQGKFHQVKRMFAAVGNKVVSLHREKIGAISLDVPQGQWRELTEAEVNAMG
ncbi:pseudouridine synthase [Shewanella sp. SR44-3]|uniref:pseudouridine synthase n=1 Tax=Shewanella sp. SR44-3 TaxID=2760936 RepID=UPI0015F9F083|nr:pseudouridine synthase [Shewanella sp. SR44-3]MBB1269487.1 pseudouridine synthase [Shewanella sp. SR44-3]